jgi:hypothetical protein
VHRVLSKAGVTLRGRGGATRTKKNRPSSVIDPEVVSPPAGDVGRESAVDQCGQLFGAVGPEPQALAELERGAAEPSGRSGHQAAATRRSSREVIGDPYRRRVDHLDGAGVPVGAASQRHLGLVGAWPGVAVAMASRRESLGCCTMIPTFIRVLFLVSIGLVADMSCRRGRNSRPDCPGLCGFLHRCARASLSIYFCWDLGSE